MTTDELNAIVKAVMDEMEKAGVDFDFKAETPQPTDLVYVMRGTADKYQGITVKWQNLLDIIVKKATDAKDEAVSAKDIALQTLATIQGIESNVSSMKSSVETTANDVSTMKASVETSEANVTQMKSEVSEMKTSVEGTKTEVEGLKAQTQTIVDNAKEDVTGLLDTKVDYSDALAYDQIMAKDAVLTNKVPSAEALQTSNKWVYLDYFGQSTTLDIPISKFPLDGWYMVICYRSYADYNTLCIVNKVDNKLVISYKNSDSIVVSSDRQTLTINADWYANAYARYLGKF